MAADHNAAQCRRLAHRIREADLHFIHPPTRYNPGDEVEFEITGVCPASPGRARITFERFVGGGFAGQVYQGRVTALEVDGPPIPGFEVGGLYAIKILIPPSRFSLWFRNTVYMLAYQGYFSAQVQPAAARSGVLWQKLFRRGAQLRFGDERCVADTYATFFDGDLGSFGEINEWVPGRIWRFETDDRICERKRLTADEASHSREYLAKKEFMAGMVHLFHEMGAPEFARQYEWRTCKSQPNVLKRLDAGEEPAVGLTAIDFRAGLALLPFLPMSPGDFGLILKGLKRGDLVQFDRGNLAKLEAFCEEYSEAFEDLQPALDELKQCDPVYRASLPDVTHHWFRLLYSAKLWRGIKEATVQGWQARGLVDADHVPRLKGSVIPFLFVLTLGLIPFLGPFFRRMLCHGAYRRHILSQFTSQSYFRQAARVREMRLLIQWRRAGRVGEARLALYLRHPSLFWTLRVFPGYLPLPATWHRFLTEGRYAWWVIRSKLGHPIRFYRNAKYRVRWLSKEVRAGAAKGMLTAEERDQILARVQDAYIQKYLKCLAVHICTVPITQVASVVAAIYAFLVLGQTYAEGLAWAGGILASFQLLIISPGSMVRGLYVVYLVIKERNFWNYRIAVFVSFLHYVGYLGFPLQMVTEFPALSRFMAGRWATNMVHIVPVFGEHGALLEHWIFDLFFNVPLSWQRKRAERRRRRKRSQ